MLHADELLAARRQRFAAICVCASDREFFSRYRHPALGFLVSSLVEHPDIDDKHAGIQKPYTDRLFFVRH